MPTDGFGTQQLVRDIRALEARRSLGDPFFAITWDHLGSELSFMLRVATLELTAGFLGNPRDWFRESWWGWWSTPRIDGESAVTLLGLCVMAEIEPLEWQRRCLPEWRSAGV